MDMSITFSVDSFFILFWFWNVFSYEITFK